MRTAAVGRSLLRTSSVDPDAELGHLRCESAGFRSTRWRTDLDSGQGIFLADLVYAEEGKCLARVGRELAYLLHRNTN